MKDYVSTFLREELKKKSKDSIVKLETVVELVEDSFKSETFISNHAEKAGIDWENMTHKEFIEMKIFNINSIYSCGDTDEMHWLDEMVLTVNHFAYYYGYKLGDEYKYDDDEILNLDEI